MEQANLSTTTLKWLFDTARWARFIAIIGFIFIGFMAIIGILIGPILSTLNEDMTNVSAFPLISNGILSVIYIIVAAIYFFPVYYLFLFSNKVMKAYKAEDEESLNSSFQYLKKHFKFIGILLIIALAIYTLMFIGGIAMTLLNLA